MNRPNESMIRGSPGYQAGVGSIAVKARRHFSEFFYRFRIPAETAIADRSSLKKNEQQEKGRTT